MILINNQPSINLEPYVDLGTLESNLPYLNYAVVKSSSAAVPSKYHGESFLAKGKVGLLDEIPIGDYDFIQDLRNHDLLGSWLRYQHNISYGQSSISVYYATSFDKKHLREHCKGTKAVEYFKVLFDWLDNQDIFKEYGRVVVFPNEPSTTTPIHHDWPDGISRKDEFIWINLDQRKKFFVYDKETDTKHYVNSKICTFDNAENHGCDAVEWATWSIRIDGIFSDKFLDKTGLTQHYRG
jgi:hypothetical protein